MELPAKGKQVELLTRTHRYVGSIPMHGYRVADLLNDGNSTTLALEEVVVSTSGLRPTEWQAQHLLLRKHDVLAAFLTGDHEAPLRRNNNRTPRRRQGALFVLPGLMLSGVIHLPGRTPAETLLTTQSLLPPFVALTSPTLHSCSFPLLDQPYEVAIIRRDWIEALELAGELREAEHP